MKAQVMASKFLRVFSSYVRSWDTIAIVFLVAWPFLYFLPITFGQTVWFSWDILRHYYPIGLEYARSLADGHLPLWTTGVQAGFPLFAEGQVGALYPVNLVIFRFMQTYYAVSMDLLLHMAWAAVGMYLCIRSFRLNAISATFGGFVFSFNGFFVAQLMHSPVLLSSSWLPWLVLLQHKLAGAWFGKRRTLGLWLICSVIAVVLLFLIGSPNIAFIDLLGFGLIGAFAAPAIGKAPATKYLSYLITTVALPVTIATIIASIQLLPTAELAQASVRTNESFQSFNSRYGLPPEFLAQFVFPFAPGEPTSTTNNEFWAYLGLVTIVFAFAAPFLRRDRFTLLVTALGFAALSFAFGAKNPLYGMLNQLPVFDSIRVPARYLLLFVFAVTWLAAVSFEELGNRLTRGSNITRSTIFAIGISILAILSIIVFARQQSLSFWLTVWQWIPVIIGALLISVILYSRTKTMSRATWNTVVLGLIILDLSLYAPAFSLTIDTTATADYVETIPHSIPTLTQPGRVFTDLSVDPSVPSLRGSLYENTALIYNRASAQHYSPLALEANTQFTLDPSPSMLNLLNVKYFMVPLEPRNEDRAPSPSPTLRLDVVDNQESIPPMSANEIQMASFTEETTDTVAGQVVAQLIVTLDTGQSKVFPLRSGFETGDWDYGRSSVTFAPPKQALVAHTLPAFWRSLGRTFDGYVYLARFQLAPIGQQANVVSVSVRPLIAKSHLTVESVTLVGDNNAHSLARLVGKDDFVLRYMSDTVAEWENLDSLPHAFLVHHAEVLPAEKVIDRMRQLGFPADQEILLTNGQPLPDSTNSHSEQDSVTITGYQSQRVDLQVSTSRAGYLVLCDSWYPGWYATVDGTAVPIYRADFIFRAIAIEPGDHFVTMEYRPMSFAVGEAVSGLGALACVIWFLGTYLRQHHSRM